LGSCRQYDEKVCIGLMKKEKEKEKEKEKGGERKML
jgi:hypothetical protein